MRMINPTSIVSLFVVNSISRAVKESDFSTVLFVASRTIGLDENLSEVVCITSHEAPLNSRCK